MEAYVAMVRLLAQWAGGDPAELSEERVREYFLHLVREEGYAPQTVRPARASLTEFFVEMLGRNEWRVFRSAKTKDAQKLPVVLTREEVKRVLGLVREERFAVPLRLIYLRGLRLSETMHMDQTLVYAHLTEVSEAKTQAATARLAAALTGGALEFVH